MNNGREVIYRDVSMSYRVRFLSDEKLIEVPVCRQAFVSLHGIGKGKLQLLLKLLKMSGNLPKGLNSE